MTTMILDPWLLASRTPEDADNDYVERLTDISFQADCPVMQFCVSAFAVDALIEDGAYPLSALSTATTGGWPQKADVIKLVNSLLDKLPKLEDYGIDDIYMEKFSVSPPFPQGISEIRSQHLIRLWSFAVLLGRYVFEDPVAIRTSCYSDLVQTAVAFDLSMVSATLVPEPGTGEYRDVVVAASDFWRLLATAEVTKAAVVYGFAEAVQLLAWQTQGGCCWWGPEAEKPKWLLGPGFGDSLIAGGFLTNSTRLRNALKACVDVVLGRNLRTTHELRVTKKATSAQKSRARDGALAWRKDVDYEYHLHYWVLKSGQIELSKVGVHNDFTIV